MSRDHPWLLTGRTDHQLFRPHRCQENPDTDKEIENLWQIMSLPPFVQVWPCRGGKREPWFLIKSIIHCCPPDLPPCLQQIFLLAQQIFCFKQGSQHLSPVCPTLLWQANGDRGRSYLGSRVEQTVDTDFILPSVMHPIWQTRGDLVQQLETVGCFFCSESSSFERSKLSILSIWFCGYLSCRTARAFWYSAFALSNSSFLH